MPSQAYTKALALAPLLSIINAQLSGMNIPVFVGDTCDYSGNYVDFSLGSGYPSCTENYFGNTGFQEINGQYNATFQIPDPGEGCEIFIRAPSNVDDPGCGVPIAFFTEAVCRTLTFPDPFDINFCCGTDDCNSAKTSTKRSLPEPIKASTSNKERREARAKRVAALEEPAATKTKWSGTKTKRQAPSDCAYAAAGSVFTTDGTIQMIGGPIDCTQPTCSDSYSASVMTGSTQSFGVSESTEAGLFDIISETVSFSYDYSYSESTTATVMFSYNIDDGTQGYMTWTPELQCTTGTFSGSGCDAAGVPTDQSGTSCIPVTDGNEDMGQPVGESNFVTEN